MKIPSSLHILLGMQHFNLILLLGFIAGTSSFIGIKDAYGYFHYVLIGFAILFIGLEMNVIASYREMKRLDISIDSVDLFKTDKVYESGHKTKLRMEFAMNFTKRLSCIILFKSVLSLIFMCQFIYSYELAERKYIDDSRVFNADARQASSHVIFVTILSSALFLLP